MQTKTSAASRAKAADRVLERDVRRDVAWALEEETRKNRLRDGNPKSDGAERRAWYRHGCAQAFLAWSTKV